MLAAREIRRYLYARSGSLPSLVSGTAASHQPVVVVAVKGGPLVTDPGVLQAAASLGPGEFLLQTTIGTHVGDRTWWVVGGDDLGALYGAYRFAEHLGVRFYLDGDVLPDAPLGPLPEPMETGRPMFSTRGILPYHDFPEGPDWWNRDDYLACVAQLAKLRMNFIGFHTYPEGDSTAEPAVWVGQAGDFLPDGTVTFAYPAAWGNSNRLALDFSFAPTPTSSFPEGAGGWFPADGYGSDVMTGLLPQPVTASQCNRVFNQVGSLFREVFAEARGLGIQSSIGTELTLSVPNVLRGRLAAQGLDPDAPATKQHLYQGIFERIAAACPADYYSLWTPETWTWQGVSAATLQAVTNEILGACQSMAAAGSPMALATCGWLLGPPPDHALMDNAVPLPIPFSSLNRSLGADPIDPAFQRLQPGRPKWAVPWLENDGNMTAPQLWAGRMRYDAADAAWIGCSGLIGLHWRTRAVQPSVAALAAAAWDLGYVPANFYAVRQTIPDGADGAGTAYSCTNFIRGTTEQEVYQTLRGNMLAYRFYVTNGAYSVTLKFAETGCTAVGQRIFAITLQDQMVIDQLDLFARAGANNAFDLTYTNILVTNGLLSVAFLPEAGFGPIVSAIVLTNTTAGLPGPPRLRKMNCGGPAVLDYEADSVFWSIPGRDANRSLGALDFYTDYATANFGPAVGLAAAAVFAAADGTALYVPGGWGGGPGLLEPDPTPWAELSTNFAFVDKFAALRPLVTGAGNLSRFDYWLNAFRCLEAEAQACSLRGTLDAAIESIAAATNSSQIPLLTQKALATRIALARAWDQMIWSVEGTVGTRSDLGTLADLQEHTLVAARFVTADDAALEAALEAPLPAAVALAETNNSPPRLIVPTVRTLVGLGEALTIQAIQFAAPGVSNPPVIQWRPLGAGVFQAASMVLVGRTTYQATLPAATNDFEFLVTSALSGSAPLVWPASGSAQTVVVWTPPVILSPPGAATAAPAPGGVALGWQSVAGAQSYTILRAGLMAGSYTAVGTTAGLNFVDHSALPGVTYWYEVIAVNADGSSAPSPPLTVVAPVRLPLSAAQAGTKVAISWPVNVAGGRLHTATNLVPPVVWQVVTNAPVNQGGTNTVTLPLAAGRAGYFRIAP